MKIHQSLPILLKELWLLLRTRTQANVELYSVDYATFWWGCLMAKDLLFLNMSQGRMSAP